MRRIGWVIAATAAVLACTGDRHMTHGFGKATGGWAGAQRVSGDDTSEAVRGLDSQEATITARAYRRGLDAKAEKGTKHEPQVLMLEKDDRGRTEARPLAPSVPKE